jgi:hypothetical protein
MAGFARVALEGEYHGQEVVNVLHYRSSGWLPGQGNPFDDTLAFLDAVLAEIQTEYLGCMSQGYKLNTITGVGYNDDYTIATPSPLVRTVNEFGTFAADVTNGAAGCGTISLRCGPQVQINNVGSSRRNRGYLAVGPLIDSHVDNESHISGTVFTAFDALAQHLDNSIIVVAPAVTLIPIRIHEKWTVVLGQRVLLWRTYSDVLGYSVRRLATFRRSRQPEA